VTPPSTRLWIVRHACAGHKDEWAGADDDRPLDPAGEVQAAALAEILSAEHPARLVSSPTRRCTDTLAPLAARVGLEVEVEPLLRDATGEELVDLLPDAHYTGAVICTHGEVMEAALGILRSSGVVVVGGADDDELLLKGAAWRVLRRDATWELELVAPVPLHACPHHRTAPGSL
jgi:phosphohistidine phosphatase SixA